MRERDLCRELNELLKELDVPVRIGLTQQGHMETVERMRAEGKTWEEVGEAIGWQAAAVERWYGIESAIRDGREPK